MADPKKKKKVGFDDEQKKAIKAKALELAQAEGLDVPTGVHAQAAVKELFTPDDLRKTFDPEYEERSRAAAEAAPAAAVGGVTKTEGPSLEMKQKKTELDKLEIDYVRERKTQLMKADENLSKEDAEKMAQSEFDASVKTPTGLGRGTMEEREAERAGHERSPLRLLPDIRKPIGEHQFEEESTINYAVLTDALHEEVSKVNKKQERSTTEMQVASLGQYVIEPKFKEYVKTMSPEKAYEKALGDGLAVYDSTHYKVADTDNYIKSERKGPDDPWYRAFAAQFQQGAGVPDLDKWEMAYLKGLLDQQQLDTLEERLAAGESYTHVELTDGTTMPKSVYDAQVAQSPELGEPVRTFEVAKTEADIKREMKFHDVEWWLDPTQKVKVIANPEKFTKTWEYGSGNLIKDVDPYGSYYENKAGQALRGSQTFWNIAMGASAYSIYDFSFSEERREARKKKGYQSEEGLASFDYVSGILQNIGENRGIMGEEREASEFAGVKTYSFSDDPDSIFYSQADRQTGETPTGWVLDVASGAGGFAAEMLFPDVDGVGALVKGAKVGTQTYRHLKGLYGAGVNAANPALKAGARAAMGDLISNNAVAGLIGKKVGYEGTSARGAITRGLTDNYAASIVASNAPDIDAAAQAVIDARLTHTAYGRNILAAQKRGDSLEDTLKGLEGFYRDPKSADDLADLGKFLSDSRASKPRQKDLNRAVLSVAEADPAVKTYLRNVELVADVPKSVQYARALMDSDITRPAFLRALAFNKASGDVIKATKGVIGFDNVVQVTPNLWAGKRSADRILKSVGSSEFGQVAKKLAADPENITLTATRERIIADPNLGTEAAYMASPVRVKEAHKVGFDDAQVISQEVKFLSDMGKLPKELAVTVNTRLSKGIITVEDMRSILNSKLDAVGEGMAASGALKGDVTRARDLARLDAGQQLDILEPLETRSFITTALRKVREEMQGTDNIQSVMSIGQKQLLGEAQARAAALDSTLRRDLKRAISDPEFRALYGIPEDATRQEVLGYLVIGPRESVAAPVGRSGVELPMVGERKRIEELLMGSLDDNFTFAQTKENIFDLLTGTRMVKNTGVFSTAGKEVLQPLLEEAAARVMQNPGRLFEETHALIKRVESLIESGAKRGGTYEDFMKTGKARKREDVDVTRQPVKDVRVDAQVKVDSVRASIAEDQRIIREAEKSAQKMTTAEKQAELKRIRYEAYSRGQELKKAEMDARLELKEQTKKKLEGKSREEKAALREQANAEAAELKTQLRKDLEEVKADKLALEDIVKADTTEKRAALKAKKQEDIARKTERQKELVAEIRSQERFEVEGIRAENLEGINRELARRWANEDMLRYPVKDIRNTVRASGDKLTAPAMIGTYYRAEANRIVDELLSDLTSKEIGKGDISIENYFDDDFNADLQDGILRVRREFMDEMVVDGQTVRGEAPALGGPKTQLHDLVTIQLKKQLRGEPSDITLDDVVGLFGDTSTAKNMRANPEKLEQVVRDTNLLGLLEHAGDAANDVARGIIRRNGLTNNDMDIEKLERAMEELKWNPTLDQGGPTQLHRKKLQLLFGDDVTEQLTTEFLSGFKELRDELVQLQAKAYETGGQAAMRKAGDLYDAFTDVVYFWLLNARTRFHGANLATGVDIVYSTTGRIVNPADLLEGAAVQVGRNPNKIQLTDNAGRSYTRRELRDILQDRTGRSVYSMKVSGADSGRNINLLEDTQGIGKLETGRAKKALESKDVGDLFSPQTREAYAAFKELPQNEDLLFRYAVLKSALNEGRSMDDAIALAKRSMFDAGNLTKAEKQLRKLALFYGFQRNNLWNALKNIMTLRGWKRISKVSRLRDRLSELLVGEEAVEFAPGYAQTRILLEQAGFGEDGKATLYMGPSLPSLDGFYGLAEFVKLQPQGVLGGAVRPELKSLVGIEDKFDRTFKEVPPEHVAYLRAYADTMGFYFDDVDPTDIINRYIMPKDKKGNVETVTMVPRKGPNGETYMSIPLNTPAQRKAYKKFYDTMTTLGIATASMDYARAAGAEGTKYEDLGTAGKLGALGGVVTATTAMDPERQAYYDMLERTKIAKDMVRSLKAQNLEQFKEDVPATEREIQKAERRQVKEERRKERDVKKKGMSRREKKAAYYRELDRLERLRDLGPPDGISARQHRILKRKAKKDYGQ